MHVPVAGTQRQRGGGVVLVGGGVVAAGVVGGFVDPSQDMVFSIILAQTLS